MARGVSKRNFCLTNSWILNVDLWVKRREQTAALCDYCFQNNSKNTGPIFKSTPLSQNDDTPICSPPLLTKRRNFFILHINLKSQKMFSFPSAATLVFFPPFSHIHHQRVHSFLCFLVLLFLPFLRMKAGKTKRICCTSISLRTLFFFIREPGANPLVKARNTIIHDDVFCLFR